MSRPRLKFIFSRDESSTYFFNNDKKISNYYSSYPSLLAGENFLVKKNAHKLCSFSNQVSYEAELRIRKESVHIWRFGSASFYRIHQKCGFVSGSENLLSDPVSSANIGDTSAAGITTSSGKRRAENECPGPSKERQLYFKKSIILSSRMRWIFSYALCSSKVIFIMYQGSKIVFQIKNGMQKERGGFGDAVTGIFLGEVVGKWVPGNWFKELKSVVIRE